MTVTNTTYYLESSAIVAKGFDVDSKEKQLDLIEGQHIEGKIIEKNEELTTIQLYTDKGSKKITVDSKQSSSLNLDDIIDVEVVSVEENKIGVKLSLLKEEAQVLASITDNEIDTEKSAASSSPVSTSNIVDSKSLYESNLVSDISRVIRDSQNPIKYSDQLDQHVERVVTEVTEILNSFTDEDIKTMINENYDIKSMSIDLLNQVGLSGKIDRKLSIVDSPDGGVVSSVNDKVIEAVIQNKLEDLPLNQIDEDRLKIIVGKLIDSPLEVTTKNVEKIENFIEKVDKVSEMTSTKVTQFLSANKELSVDELYKSLFMSQSASKKDVMTEAQYSEIEEDVAAILNERFPEGYSEDVYETAKTVVMKGIPLDDRALDLIEFVEEDQADEKLVDIGIKQIVKQEKPSAYLVTEAKTDTSIASKRDVIDTLKTLRGLDAQDVVEMKNKGQLLTISNLEIEHNSQTMDVPIDNDDYVKDIQPTDNDIHVKDIQPTDNDIHVKDIKPIDNDNHGKDIQPIDIQANPASNDSVDEADKSSSKVSRDLTNQSDKVNANEASKTTESQTMNLRQVQAMQTYSLEGGKASYVRRESTRPNIKLVSESMETEPVEPIRNLVSEAESQPTVLDKVSSSEQRPTVDLEVINNQIDEDINTQIHEDTNIQIDEDINTQTQEVVEDKDLVISLSEKYIAADSDKKVTEALEVQQKQEVIIPAEVVSSEADSYTQISNIDPDVEDLEVLRYQMTFKAAMRLSIEGVDLKNTQLSKLRERLEVYEKDLVLHSQSTELTSKVEGTSQESSVDVDVQSSQANQKISSSQSQWASYQRSIALISASTTEVIANEALNEESQTITISNMASKAKIGTDRYDQLRTQPRSDLGDKIEKAFTNVDEILDDLNLEKTEYNQRAVQILGRNELPITRENIDKVKEVDIELQTIIKNIMPEHVAKLAADGVDILSEPIEDLANKVIEMETTNKKDMGDSIAKHVHALLKMDNIEPEVKETVMGTYRLLNTIENTKGAAVGLLVKEDMEVTLENLFNASKFIKQKSGNEGAYTTIVDDETGLLDEIRTGEKTIKEQIQSGYFEKNMETDQLLSKVINGDLKTNTEESSSLLTSSIEVLNSPGSIVTDDLFGQQVEIEDDAIDQKVIDVLKSVSNQVNTSDVADFKSSLASIENLDKALLKQIIELDPDAGIDIVKGLTERASEPFVLKDKINEVIETMQNMNMDLSSEALAEDINRITDQVLSKLVASVAGESEISIADVDMTAEELISEEYLEKMLESTSESQNSSSFSNGQSQRNNDEDSLTIRGDDEDEITFLIKELKDQIKVSLFQSATTSVDKDPIKQIKELETQVQVNKSVENDNHFTIPVMLNGALQQLNLYYSRNTEKTVQEDDSMTLYMSFSTENIGTANIRLQMTDDSTSMSIYSTAESGTEHISHYSGEIIDAFSGLGMTVNNLNYDEFEVPKPIKSTEQNNGNMTRKYQESKFEKVI